MPNWSGTTEQNTRPEQGVEPITAQASPVRPLAAAGSKIPSGPVTRMMAPPQPTQPNHPSLVHGTQSPWGSIWGRPRTAQCTAPAPISIRQGLGLVVLGTRVLQAWERGVSGISIALGNLRLLGGSGVETDQWASHYWPLSPGA